MRAVDRFGLLPYLIVGVVSVVATVDASAANSHIRSRVLVIGALGVRVIVVTRQALTIADIRPASSERQRTTVGSLSHDGSGTVLIRAEEEGDMARVEVHDDGPGIPVRYRRVVWDLFERGAHRLDAEHPGTGSGLPVARAIVTAIGGKIRYEDSPLLGGALFVVHVPLVETRARTSSP